LINNLLLYYKVLCHEPDSLFWMRVFCGMCRFTHTYQTISGLHIPMTDHCRILKLFHMIMDSNGIVFLSTVTFESSRI